MPKHRLNAIEPVKNTVHLRCQIHDVRSRDRYAANGTLHDRSIEVSLIWGNIRDLESHTAAFGAGCASQSSLFLSGRERMV